MPAGKSCAPPPIGRCRRLAVACLARLCYPFAQLSDQTSAQPMTATAPTATSMGVNSIARAQWLVLAAAFLGWMFDGVEMGIFPLVARPALQSMIPASALGQDQFVGLWMGR